MELQEHQVEVISSPASLSDKPAAAAIWEEISALEDPLDRGFVEEFVRSTSPELQPEDFVDTLIAESLKVPARVWQQTLRGLIDADVRANLERITAPTLLIAGDADTFSAMTSRRCSMPYRAPG